MQNVIKKSILAAITISLLSYAVRVVFRTDLSISDVGGISAFVSVFGTLYGIMSAFVVFEVWAEYNKTTELIQKEALGLERLFRLILYFRDNKLAGEMKNSIKAYADNVISNKFKSLGQGVRRTESGILFRKISEIIRDIKFDDDHDQLVFQQILAQYGNVSETRSERVTQSLTRLPLLLKVFLYISSAIALLTFVIMPFANVFYGFFTVFTISLVLAMVIQLVEDLDNPFVGHWNLSPEPFERTLKHIEEDY